MLHRLIKENWWCGDSEVSVFIGSTDAESAKFSGKFIVKICHVITRMIVGGAQENTLLTLKGHLENGHETTLLTGPTTGPEGALLEKQPLAGLRTIEVSDLIRAVHPLRDLRAYIQLRRHFQKNKYDVVHTHSAKGGVLGRLAARAAGVPVVVHTQHGPVGTPDDGFLKATIYTIMERWAARCCDRIFSVARAMTDQGLARGIGHEELYRTVHSGMDLEPYRNVPTAVDSKSRRAAQIDLGISDDAIVVGKVARIFEQKGYDYLLEAAEKVVAVQPNVVFLIVGDGNLRPWFEREIEQRGLRANFVLVGLVRPAEVPHYIGLMDLLVHLSVREGLPRVVVQALACGRPAVGFDMDGTPEVLLPGKTGWLCPPRDAAAVADCMARALADPAKLKQLGQQGREFVWKSWDWRFMVQQLEKQYAELLLAKGYSNPGKKSSDETWIENRDDSRDSRLAG